MTLVVINSWSARQKATAGATSDGVERITAGKRVKFNMRESADLSEGVEEGVNKHHGFLRDIGETKSCNTPSCFVTRIETPSLKQTL